MIIRVMYQTPIVIYYGTQRFIASPLVTGTWRRCVYGWKVTLENVGFGENADLTANQRKGLPGNNAKYFSFYMMMLGLLLPGALGQSAFNGVKIPEDVVCSLTTNVFGSINSCVQSGAQETCNLILEGTLTLRIGESSCLSVSDKEGNFLATIVVNYEQMSAQAPLATQYYTSDWSLHEASTIRCHGASGCDNGHCGEWKKTMDVCAQAGSNSHMKFNCQAPYSTYPGMNWCSNQRPEGFTCMGGLEPNDSCVVYTNYIQPEGPVYQVMIPTEVDYVPYISIAVLSHDPDTITGDGLFIMGSGGSVSTATGLAFTIVGNYAGPDTIFGSKAIIVNTANTSLAYYGDIAPVGSPILGIWGDIQSQSASGFSTNNKRWPNAGFIFTPTMMTCNDNKAGVRHCVPTNNRGVPTSSASSTVLPAKIGKSYWYYDPDRNMLLSNMSNPGALVVGVSITGNGISITKQSNQVCPDIVALNATGCYNCESGVTLQVTATSDCGSGHARLSADANYVILDTQDIILIAQLTQVWSIRLTTGRAENNFNIIMTDDSGKYMSKMPVKFIASKYTYNDTGFNDQQQAYGAGLIREGTTYSYDKNSVSWGNWFGNLPSIPQPFQIFLTYLLWAAVIIVVICIASYLFDWSLKLGKDNDHLWHKAYRKVRPDTKDKDI
jgi:hypothetical protein